MGPASLCRKLANITASRLAQTDSRIGNRQRLINPGGFDKARGGAGRHRQRRRQAAGEIYFRDRPANRLWVVLGQEKARPNGRAL